MQDDTTHEEKAQDQRAIDELRFERIFNPDLDDAAKARLDQRIAQIRADRAMHEAQARDWADKQRRKENLSFWLSAGVLAAAAIAIAAISYHTGYKSGHSDGYAERGRAPDALASYQAMRRFAAEEQLRAAQEQAISARAELARLDATKALPGKPQPTAPGN